MRPFEYTVASLCDELGLVPRLQPLVTRLASDMRIFAGWKRDQGRIPWERLGCVTRACLWRIVAAQYVAKHARDYEMALHANTALTNELPPAVRPWDMIEYKATLWGDTHLDMIIDWWMHAPSPPASPDADNAFWFKDAMQRLGQVWPLPHRVLCADELPDLAPYLVHADLVYESGKVKCKTPPLARELVHLFLCKMMNQICHSRHLNDTIFTYMQSHIEIEQLVATVLKCSLLGNYPTSQTRMGWTARMRVSMQLNPPPPLPEFMAWMDKRPYLVMFALREWFLYTVEASHVTDKILSLHMKWPDFKAISRHAMSEVRAALSAQAAADMTARTQWDGPVETPPRPRKKRSKVLLDLWKKHEIPAQYQRHVIASTPPVKGKRRPKAILNLLHTASLPEYEKLKKNKAEDVVLKKGTCLVANSYPMVVHLFQPLYYTHTRIHMANTDAHG